MKLDEFGQQIYSEQDICELYQKNPDIILKNVLVSDSISNSLELNNFPKLTEYKKPNLTLAEFDLENQNTWLMPDEYKNIDIAKWVLERCSTDEELQRAGQELLLFQERDMFNLLRYLKYLVDTMRENNIVWGVGRGSSVASFVLYLIGIHKINSLYYDLPIEEFLK